jgi:hypothetical protein
MPLYKCPISTCNIHFEGSIWDIIPRAIAHADGFHRVIYTEEEAKNLIIEQNNPKHIEPEIINPSDTPPLPPADTGKDLTPEPVAPSEPLTPPISLKDMKPMGTVGNDEVIDAWWDRVLGNK